MQTEQVFMTEYLALIIIFYHYRYLNKKRSSLLLSKHCRFWEKISIKKEKYRASTHTENLALTW